MIIIFEVSQNWGILSQWNRIEIDGWNVSKRKWNESLRVTNVIIGNETHLQKLLRKYMQINLAFDSKRRHLAC